MFNTYCILWAFFLMTSHIFSTNDLEFRCRIGFYLTHGTGVKQTLDFKADIAYNK